MHAKRTFVITGATKGIGYATAKRLHQQGHHIIGIARHKPTNEFPGDLHILDLLDECATEKIFKIINEKYQIDGIVNNVGIAVRDALENVQLKDLRTVLDLNLRPALQATQIFINGMIDRKFGRIVNISSRAVLGSKNATSYAAAKAGMIAFTRIWALELAQKGITVNAVAPGPTETEHFRQQRPKGSEAELMSLRSIPMNRLGQPNEIAATIDFFLSEEAGFITGQTLFVDGGGSIGSQLI